jgi:hypothetical protein
MNPERHPCRTGRIESTCRSTAGKVGNRLRAQPQRKVSSGQAEVA